MAVGSRWFYVNVTVLAPTKTSQSTGRGYISPSNETPLSHQRGVLIVLGINDFLNMSVIEKNQRLGFRLQFLLTKPLDLHDFKLEYLKSVTKR